MLSDSSVNNGVVLLLGFFCGFFLVFVLFCLSKPIETELGHLNYLHD